MRCVISPLEKITAWGLLSKDRPMQYYKLRGNIFYVLASLKSMQTLKKIREITESQQNNSCHRHFLSICWEN